MTYNWLNADLTHYLNILISDESINTDPFVSQTYLESFPQMTRAVLSSISDPSSRIESHTRSTVDLGRHVANIVRNHCIVNTLVNGGS